LANANQEIIDAFKEAFSTDKSRLKRWTTVAQRYLNLYGRNKYERHWEAEDILKELIAKIIEGKRNYDPEKYKNADDFIFKSIRSIVDDELRNRNKVKSYDKCTGTNEDGERSYTNILEKRYKTDKDTVHDEYIIEEQLENCYQLLLEDEEAALVFLEWQKGLKSCEIAESLGLELKEVEQAKKRIRYKLTNGLKR
jgi:RNA polymerase sigma factor (sigma-70 family)